MRIYLLIFGATFSTLVIPLPEELTLLGAGYSARMGEANLVLAFFSAWLAIMCGDWITFFAGKALLPRLLKSRIGRRVIKPERQEWATRFVNRHGVRAIAIGRFLVALRGPVYLAVGASKYRTSKFLLVNGLVGLAEVALVVGTGYWIGPNEQSAHRLRVVDYVIAGAILLVTVLIPLVFKKYLRPPPADSGAPATR